MNSIVVFQETVYRIISKQIEYGRLDSFRLNTNSYRLFWQDWIMKEVCK